MGCFSLSCHRAFAQALLDSWDFPLFPLHLVTVCSSLRYQCKHPFFPSSFPSSLRVKTSMITVCTLCHPLRSNNHNPDLVMVCVVIRWDSLRAETPIISCSSPEPPRLAQSWHMHTQEYLFRREKKKMSDHLVQIPHLENEETQAQWHMQMPWGTCCKLVTGLKAGLRVLHS